MSSSAGEPFSRQLGHPAIERIAPEGLWGDYSRHPDEARVFDAAMIAKSTAETTALIPAFDFTPYGTIADIGGGRGHILAAVLAAAPRAK